MTFRNMRTTAKRIPLLTFARRIALTIALTIPMTIALSSAVFAAKTAEVSRSRWEAATPTVTESVQSIWGGHIPRSRLDEANSLGLDDLRSYQVSLQSALGEVSLLEMTIGRKVDAGELAIGNSRLEMLLNSAEGLALGSDLRFKGFQKAIQSSDQSFNKSQYVGMVQLFLMKEWLIAHSVIHAKTIQRAIENPSDRQNEEQLNQASRQLTDFLDSTAEAIKGNTIASTQLLFDTLPREQSNQLRLAMGLDFAQLKEIDANLVLLKSLEPNPSLEKLTEMYGEAPARHVSRNRSYSPKAPSIAMAILLFNPYSVYVGAGGLLFGFGSNIGSAIGYSAAFIYGIHGIYSVVRYLSTVSSDKADTKYMQSMQKQRLLEQYNLKREQILKQFLFMGQSAYTCSDILQP